MVSSLFFPFGDTRLTLSEMSGFLWLSNRETEAQLCSLEACVSIVASKTHKTLADVKDNHWDEVLLAQAEHHRIFEEMIKEIWVFWRGYLKSLSHYERDALTGVFGVLDHLHGFFDLDQGALVGVETTSRFTTNAQLATAHE